MKKFQKRAVTVLSAATILGTSVFSGVIASGTDIKGKIANMTIFNNGAAMSIPADQKPIIVNNRTYLPIRALGEALGKQIDWNASNPNSVYISGGQDQATFNQMALDLNQSKIQIAEKDSKIKTLEAKVKELEDKIKNQDKVSSLSDLEKQLNKDYGRYKYVDLDIQLSGTESKVKVKVYISKSYRSEWDYLTVSEREKLVENIVYDIQREYKKASIEGYVDSGYSSTSMDFYTDTKDKLVIKGGTGSSSGYYSDSEMSRYLEDRYYKDVYRVVVSSSGYYVDVIVDLDYDLTPSQISYLADDMKSDIVYNMKNISNRDITIKVYYKDGKLAGTY